MRIMLSLILNDANVRKLLEHPEPVYELLDMIDEQSSSIFWTIKFHKAKKNYKIKKRSSMASSTQRSHAYLNLCSCGRLEDPTCSDIQKFSMIIG